MPSYFKLEWVDLHCVHKWKVLRSPYSHMLMSKQTTVEWLQLCTDSQLYAGEDLGCVLLQLHLPGGEILEWHVMCTHPHLPRGPNSQLPIPVCL